MSDTRTTAFKHPPLVEVMVEVRWAMQPGLQAGIQVAPQVPGLLGLQPGAQVDPHYAILLGRFYDRIKTDYPQHDTLPTAAIPDQLTGGVVKHQFRIGANRWPLVQLGPGVMTVNSTQEYTTFEEFRPRVIKAVKALTDSYPSDLQINSLSLRYIDAYDFDYNQSDLWVFMKEKMHIPVSLPKEFFQDDKIASQPTFFQWRGTFRCENPKGQGTLGVSTGIKLGRPAILWEQVLQSSVPDLPEMPGRFEEWLVEAHKIVETWFFCLIAGDLSGEFDRD